jgi:hypothetical protein
MKEARPKIRRWPKWLVLACCSIGIFFILILANVIVNGIVQNKVREKLQLLSPVAKISFSSIRSNLFTASISLNNLKIDYTPDSNHCEHQHSVYFSAVELTGINFFKVIFRQTLSINNLKLRNGSIKLDPFLLNKKDSLQHNTLPQIPLQNISIRHSELTAINIWMHADQKDRLLLKGNIAIEEISIKDLNKPFNSDNLHFGAFDSNLSDINYVLPETYHTLQIKNLTIDSKKEILQINSLKIIPLFSKPTFFRKTKNQSILVESTISNITMLKLNVMKLFDRKLIAGKIAFDQTDVNIYSKAIESKTPIASLKEIPLEIQIDTFRVNHSSIAYEGSLQNSRSAANIFDSIPFKDISINHLEIVKTNLSLNQLKLNGDIGIDKIKMIRIGQSLHVDSFSVFTCALTDISYSIPGAYHNIQIKKLLIDSKEKILQLAFLKIIPQYDKFKVGQKSGHQTDVVDATITDIQIINLDVLKLLEKKLIGERILIGESKMYVFRDRRLPRLLEHQPLPVALFKSLPVSIRVNNVHIDHSTISYEEFPKDGLQTGILKIEKFQLSLSPFITHPVPSDPDHMNMNVDGAIMGSGTLHVLVYLPFNPKKDYYIKGEIGNLELTSLNSAAENLGKFHIESGMLNTLAFHFSLNEEKAKGAVVGEYHHLVVDKLKGKMNKTAWFPSFMLKHLIIPKNKDKSMDVSNRTGIIDYKCDSTRLFSFNLLKSLLSGIRASFTLGFFLPK